MENQIQIIFKIKGKKQQKGATTEEYLQGVDPLSSAQISADELFTELQRKLPTEFQIPAALWDELADDFVDEANKIYKNGIKEAWQKMTADSGEQQEMRKAYEEKMVKVGETYSAICMFQKGAEALKGGIHVIIILGIFYRINGR